MATTIRSSFQDRKRMKHSTSMPMIQDFHRRSSFRYCSSIHNSGTSLNSILEGGDQDARQEKATTCTTSSTSQLVSRSASTPLPVTDFWHSTRTMKKTQTCTALSGLLDMVSMDDDDDDDRKEEIDEDFDNENEKMDVANENDDENCEGGFQF
mmetsp:Transcript_21288/g.24442  ORF Transcript_21288/g.24442 Transcript_21288/m.24442 type:complete len:153 (-) Transcript_21288:70-528(-)